MLGGGDGSKWISSIQHQASPSQSSGGGVFIGDDGLPKQRLRRVACTCPNCRDGDR